MKKLSKNEMESLFRLIEMNDATLWNDVWDVDPKGVRTIIYDCRKDLYYGGVRDFDNSYYWLEIYAFENEDKAYDWVEGRIR